MRLDLRDSKQVRNSILDLTELQSIWLKVAQVKDNVETFYIAYSTLPNEELNKLC